MTKVSVCLSKIMRLGLLDTIFINEFCDIFEHSNFPTKFQHYYFLQKYLKIRVLQPIAYKTMHIDVKLKGAKALGKSYCTVF